MMISPCNVVLNHNTTTVKHVSLVELLWIGKNSINALTMAQNGHLMIQIVKLLTSQSWFGILMHMKTNSIEELLKTDTKFLLVGSGESYNSEVVTASELFPKAMSMMFGDDLTLWPDECINEFKTDLHDVDNWMHDADWGPTEFHQDLGETDHIRIIRITG